MGGLKKYYFGKVKAKVNTYIGGVASVLSTPSLLATALGISVNRIKLFSVIGNDIQCSISGNYVIQNPFSNGISGIITYYKDVDGLVTSIGGQAFYNTTIQEVYTPKATSILTSAFDQNIMFSNNLRLLYAPLVVTIGNTVGNDTVFRSGNLGGGIIYANPSLQTVNSGGVEGDLAYLATGNAIRYVANFTSPNGITDLSVGIIYNTIVQLNFTAPTSTNAIDYYEIYVNGILSQKIKSSGQFVGNLTASTIYDIKVVAVDVFYNKSVFSNSISITTTNVSAVPLYDFMNRVIIDKGVLIDEAYMATEYSKITSNGLSSYLLFWHNYKSAIKKDYTDLIEKIYSFSGQNTDIIQATRANKPLYTATGVAFDSTDELKKTLVSAITNKTFSIVWRVKGTPGNFYPLVSLSASDWNGFQMHSASSGPIYSGITVANRFALANGSFLNNTDATYVFTYNSVSKSANIYRNTTLLSTKTMVDPIDFTSITINSTSGSHTFYDLKMFSKELSLTEITNIL